MNRCKISKHQFLRSIRVIISISLRKSWVSNWEILASLLREILALFPCGLGVGDHVGCLFSGGFFCFQYVHKLQEVHGSAGINKTSHVYYSLCFVKPTSIFISLVFCIHVPHYLRTLINLFLWFQSIFDSRPKIRDYINEMHVSTSFGHLYKMILTLLQCQSRQLMHCDTLKQDNDSTVRGDGGSRIGEVRAGTTSPMP